MQGRRVSNSTCPAETARCGRHSVKVAAGMAPSVWSLRFATGETEPDVDLDYWRRHCYAARPGRVQPPHIRRRRPAGLTPPLCPRTAAVTNLPVGPRPQALPTRPSVA